MSGYASTGGRNVNPSWPGFVEHEADLERAERAASGESLPTFILPPKLTSAEMAETYDQWMAAKIGKTVDELRAGRAEFKAEEAAKKAAREFEAAIEIDFAETAETEIAE